MITEDQVIPSMLETLPCFGERWNRHLARWNGKPAGAYNDVGQFAHEIVRLHDQGATESLVAGLALVERLIVEGDAAVRRLAVVGVLEDVQTLASHRQGSYADLERHLGPASMSAWRHLEEVWRGRDSLAEVIAAEAGIQPRQERPPWWAFWRKRRKPEPPIDLASIENPELREIVEELNRTLGLRGKGGADVD